MPPLEGRAPLPLPGLREGLLDHVRHAVRQSQAPAARYLAAIAIFCNEVKGKSALALSRDLDVSYKCAFVLLHKLREAMASELKGRVSAGKARSRKSDGGYFGGYVKPANFRENRRDRRFLTQSERQAQALSSSSASVAAIRFRQCSSGSQGNVDFFERHVAKGTILNADEAAVMGGTAQALRGSPDQSSRGVSAATALAPIGPKNFSAVCVARRSATITTSPAPYLLRYAQEASWREDNRRASNGDQVNRVAALAMPANRLWISAGTGSGT